MCGRVLGAAALLALAAALLLDRPAQAHDSTDNTGTPISGYGVTMSPSSIKASDFTGSLTNTKTISITPTGGYTIAYQWERIRDEAGPPGRRIHDVRHWWTSTAAMNGVDRVSVAK
ncbi:MAG: hypothetical protein OXC14_21685 [Rhodospirillaceae bacterium]|nr:hypothetical protein [Rhodospirillaceae bacterium]